MNIEETPGYKVAITFKPFIDPKASEHMEIVKDMAKAINSAIKKGAEKNYNSIIDIEFRVKQLLSVLDYEKLTDYQAKVVLLLEKEMYPKK